MDPKTKIRSEVYRLFNPYHDAKGLFTTSTRSGVGAVKAAAKRGKKVIGTVAKGTAGYHAAKGVQKTFKSKPGKRAAKWMKEHPEETAAIIVTGVGLAACIASRRFETSLREAAAKSTLGDDVYTHLKGQGVKFTK